MEFRPAIVALTLVLLSSAWSSEENSIPCSASVFSEGWRNVATGAQSHLAICSGPPYDPALKKCSSCETGASIARLERFVEEQCSPWDSVCIGETWLDIVSKMVTGMDLKSYTSGIQQYIEDTALHSPTYREFAQAINPTVLENKSTKLGEIFLLYYHMVLKIGLIPSVAFIFDPALRMLSASFGSIVKEKVITDLSDILKSTLSITTSIWPDVCMDNAPAHKTFSTLGRFDLGCQQSCDSSYSTNAGRVECRQRAWKAETSLFDAVIKKSLRESLDKSSACRCAQPSCSSSSNHLNYEKIVPKNEEEGTDEKKTSIGPFNKVGLHLMKCSATYQLPWITRENVLASLFYEGLSKYLCFATAIDMDAPELQELLGTSESKVLADTINKLSHASHSHHLEMFAFYLGAEVISTSCTKHSVISSYKRQCNIVKEFLARLSHIYTDTSPTQSLNAIKLDQIKYFKDAEYAATLLTRVANMNSVTGPIPCKALEMLLQGINNITTPQEKFQIFCSNPGATGLISRPNPKGSIRGDLPPRGTNTTCTPRRPYSDTTDRVFHPGDLAVKALYSHSSASSIRKINLSAIFGDICSATSTHLLDSSRSKVKSYGIAITATDQCTKQLLEIKPLGDNPSRSFEFLMGAFIKAVVLTAVEYPSANPKIGLGLTHYHDQVNAIKAQPGIFYSQGAKLFVHRGTVLNIQRILCGQAPLTKTACTTESAIDDNSNAHVAIGM